jgi:hypothetical protein
LQEGRGMAEMQREETLQTKRIDCP